MHWAHADVLASAGDEPVEPGEGVTVVDVTGAVSVVDDEVIGVVDVVVTDEVVVVDFTALVPW